VRTNSSVLLVLAVSLAVGASARVLGAQHAHPTGAAADSTMPMPAHARAGIGAQAVLSGTRLVHAIDGRTLTEGYLSQPALMGHAALADGHVALTGTLNFEGLTLRRGELLGGV
jgi:hypothetical protein